ncbi:MAG: hypothetical protein ACLQNG_02945 [Acidimicrobiales bacterium]|jgi:hypothetical protein
MDEGYEGNEGTQREQLSASGCAARAFARAVRICPPGGRPDPSAQFTTAAVGKRAGRDRAFHRSAAEQRSVSSFLVTDLGRDHAAGPAP